MVKNLPANAGDIDAGSIPGSGRSLGEGYGSPLQYSRPENSIVRGAWQATVHSVAKNRARLKRLSKHVQRKYSICKLFLELHEWLVSRNIFVPRGHTAMSRDVLGCHNSGVLLAFGGWRPGVLLMFYTKLNNPHNKGSSSSTCQFCQG